MTISTFCQGTHRNGENTACVFRCTRPCSCSCHQPARFEPITGPKPNPGSDAAVALGCTCARHDNNRGLDAPRPPDGWWVTEGCPVHAKEEAK